MTRTGAQLAVYALEQIGVKNTFGIPGVHNTELYDELNKSEQIRPVLVTHEGCASFMADGISRTSGTIGTLVIVPAAGTTHAMSGIGEAFLDGIPMLVISGGTRTDSGRHYQLHQLDQMELVRPLTKAQFRAEKHEDIIPMIYKAYDIAVSGEPGPVFVEIPVNLQLFTGEVNELPTYSPKARAKDPDTKAIAAAVDRLMKADRPVIYVGWGAVDAHDLTVELADLLGAPVSTTLQGKSSFPHDHPLHTGVAFGATGKPAAQNAFKDHDCMLAVGVRFAELATGSYGIKDPVGLIHCDINPTVFNKNYRAELTIEGDAREVMRLILEGLRAKGHTTRTDKVALAAQIKADHEKYTAEWMTDPKKDRVSPGLFFRALRKQIERDAFIVVDDGTHTFLTAELMDVYHPRHFISPTDYNAMGYCVPAAIGTKLRNPDKQVVGIVGDGAFLMTGMELLTASSLDIAPMIFIFHDGELGQIAQLQEIPLNRKTCTVIGDAKFSGMATAAGAHYIDLDNDGQIDAAIAEAIRVSSEGTPVLVDVRIDYSKKTMLTKGVVKTNLSRFPLKEKIRFIGRAIKRHVLG